MLHFKICWKKENYYLLKSLGISYSLAMNLKEGYYHISAEGADSFIKNNAAYDLRVGTSFIV